MTAGYPGFTALGVHDRQLHRIPGDADTVALGGIRYWWSPPPCRAMCRDLPEGNFNPCGVCFPEREEFDWLTTPTTPTTTGR